MYDKHRIYLWYVKYLNVKNKKKTFNLEQGYQKLTKGPEPAMWRF